MDDIIEFDKEAIITNSPLFKIGDIDGEKALYLKDNEYSGGHDDTRGKVALFGDIVADFSLRAELKFLGHHMEMKRAGWFGFAFRAQDTENYELVWFMPNAEGSDTVAYVPVAHGIVPWWTEAYDVQAKGNPRIPSERWFSTGVDVKGDKFTVTVFEKPVFAKKVTYYLDRGFCGFYVGTGTDAAIRRVRITELTGDPNS